MPFRAMLDSSSEGSVEYMHLSAVASFVSFFIVDIVIF